MPEVLKQEIGKSPGDSLWWLGNHKPETDFSIKSQAHQKLLNQLNSRFGYMKDSQGRLRVRAEDNEQLYKNNDFFEFFEKYKDYIPKDFYNRMSNYGDPRTILNICRSCVNAAQNKISKINPVVQLNTKLFSPLRRDKVAHFQDDIQDWMQRGEIYAEGQQVFFNTNVAEIGYLKVMPKPEMKNFMFNAPNPLSVLIEHPFEGTRYRSEIWEYGYVEKYEIEDRFGVKLKGTYTEENRILLMEAFKAHKYHVISTDQEVIFLENWDFEIPYFDYRWSPALRGFATFGLISEIKPIQNSVNNLVADIESSFKLMGRPRWFVEHNSNVSKDNLMSAVSAITRYTKTMPEAYQPKPINEGYFNWVEYFINQAYQLSGVSEIYAGGDIPPRMEARSGEMLEAYDTIRSDRFQIPTQNYEGLFKRIGGFMLEFASKHWKKDKYSYMQVKEARAWTSMLASEHPAGQHKQAKELLGAGLITPDDYFQAIQYNNLEKVIKNTTISRMAAYKKLHEMTESGKFFTPDPHLGYDVQLNVASRFYKLGVYNDMSEEKLKTVSEFITKVEKLIEAEQAQNPPLPDLDEKVPQPAPTLQPPLAG